MKTKWMMGTACLAISHVAFCADWQESQTITEYFVDGADSGERLYVGFEYSPNPESCDGRADYARVNGDTEKGKYLFSIILSAHASKQSVNPNQGAAALTFSYGPDRSRYKQVAVVSGSTETTHYVGGLYEKIIKGSLTTQRYYKQVAVVSGSTETTHYVGVCCTGSPSS